MEPTVYGLGWWQRVAVAIGSGLVRLWQATLRVEFAPGALAAAAHPARPLLIHLWHNDLFLASLYRRRLIGGQRTAAVVSASKDGAWVDAFMARASIRIIRGSSSRFGREALHAVVQALRGGEHVAITPDGPRGPVYTVEGGGVIAARRAQADVVLFGADLTAAWRIDTWDGFFLPRPFSRIVVRAELIPLERIQAEADPVGFLRTRFLALAAEANEQRFRAPPRMEKKRAEAAAAAPAPKSP